MTNDTRNEDRIYSRIRLISICMRLRYSSSLEMFCQSRIASSVVQTFVQERKERHRCLRRASCTRLSVNVASRINMEILKVRFSHSALVFSRNTFAFAFVSVSALRLVRSLHTFHRYAVSEIS